MKGIDDNAMAAQIDVIWGRRCGGAGIKMDPQSSGTPSHLWCIFDCRTKALKARSRFLHPLGNHSNLPEIFPTNCTFVTPAHFTKFMGPHQICFMSLESNPKGREEVKKIIGQLVFSFQGGLGVPRAQRELQLDSQFAAAEKANKLI